MSTSFDTFMKDPAEVLDYKFDWAPETNGTGNSDWLAAGETITSHTITVPTGITVDSSALSDANTSVTVWLSGGTAGTDYAVECEIDTTAGRTAKRTMMIAVRER
ncbi:MAG: hypothetical protein GWN58_47410 [Anaerolineae bacterium]|nr:hypothetical protein [Anaerolineae bacterium]